MPDAPHEPTHSVTAHDSTHSRSSHDASGARAGADALAHHDGSGRRARGTAPASRTSGRTGAHTAPRHAASRTGARGAATHARTRRSVGSHSRASSRRPAPVALALAVLALVVVVVVAVIILAPASTQDESEKQLVSAGDAAMESVVSPDATQREAMASEVSGALEDSGLTFDDMGLSAEEFASWMFDSASYELQETLIDEETGTAATLTYAVTSNKVDVLLEDVSEEVADMDYEGITTMSEAYVKIGEIMLEKMDESVPSEKTIELSLTLEDGTWSVDATQLEELPYSVFYE